MAKNPRVSATVKQKTKDSIEKLMALTGETESGQVAVILDRYVPTELKRMSTKTEEKT